MAGTICIYCKEDSSGSTGRAHVVPASFLDNDVVLPPGAECDKCNGYAGALETAFLHHNRIWTLIVLHGTPGRGGKTKRRLGYLRNDSGRTGDISGEVKQEHIESVTFSRSGVRFHLGDPKQFDDLKFRRALHHIGLNYVAWKFGVDRALDPEFDEVRRYVRHARRGESWQYAQLMHPDNAPRRELRIGWIEEAPGLTVRLVSFVDDFYVDVLNSGSLHEWAQDTLPDGVGLL